MFSLFSPTAEAVTDNLDLSGKTYLVTGCAGGLGFESCRVLAMRNATVLCAARSVSRAQEACDAIQKKLIDSKGRLIPIACDLADPKSISACVSEVKNKGFKLDGILCNAGIMAVPKLTLVHGFESQWFTNHFGHFMLVNGLMDSLTPKGRVVVVSGDAYQWAFRNPLENLDGSKAYQPFRAYGTSKLCNVWFSNELARRMALVPGNQQTSNVLQLVSNWAAR